MSLISKGKKIVDKYPKINTLASKIFSLLGCNRTYIKGLNNIVQTKNSFLKKSRTFILGNNNTITTGYKTILENCNVYINGNNNVIVIGDKVLLRDVELHIEDNDNEIFIENNTTFSGKTHLACIEGKRILIGKDCMFSSEVVIRTGDSHSIINMSGERINPSQDVIIGNHVWLGNKTIVTKGAIISDNSIVGTGTIVTKEFKKNGVILAGSPAKVVKDNINWSRERI